MSDLQELTNEFMQDEEFRKEYQALKPEREVVMSYKGYTGSVQHPAVP